MNGAKPFSNHELSYVDDEIRSVFQQSGGGVVYRDDLSCRKTRKNISKPEAKSKPTRAGEKRVYRVISTSGDRVIQPSGQRAIG
jgi:hypothetical protein